MAPNFEEEGLRSSRHCSSRGLEGPLGFIPVVVCYLLICSNRSTGQSASRINHIVVLVEVLRTTVLFIVPALTLNACNFQTGHGRTVPKLSITVGDEPGELKPRLSFLVQSALMKKVGPSSGSLTTPTHFLYCNRPWEFCIAKRTIGKDKLL